VTFLYMCAESKNSADHVHFWVIPLNFCATCGSSVEISAKFFAVIGPEFKNNYLVSNIRIPTKAVFESEISKFHRNFQTGENICEVVRDLDLFAHVFIQALEEATKSRAELQEVVWK